MWLTNERRAAFGEKRTLMRAAFCSAIVALVTSVIPALAQQGVEVLPGDETDESIEPIRRYTVELIIFAYGAGVSAGNEIWVPDEPAIKEAPGSNPSAFSETGEVLTGIESSRVARQYMDPELTMLGRRDYTMNEIYDKLVKLDAYKPIMRAGWTQPTYEKAVTAPIPLRRLGNPPQRLNGSLTLYLGRYLHLVVDLTMDANKSGPLPREETSASARTFGDSRTQNEYGMIDEYGELLRRSIRYRIFEDRIMKNGDIRYFDHPKFGVIAKITRVEESEEEIDDDTDDLLPGSSLSP